MNKQRNHKRPCLLDASPDRSEEHSIAPTVLIHFFRKHVLSPYYVTNPMPGPGFIVETKHSSKSSGYQLLPGGSFFSPRNKEMLKKGGG